MTLLNKEFILLSKRVVTPSGIKEAAVHVKDGIIKDVLEPNQLPSSLDIPVKDMGNLVIMPGIVDTHVHVNEPGRTEWEGFETATQAAAAGGITSIFDMPLNSNPVTTSAAALDVKLKAAKGKLWVDCGFYGGVVPGNADEIEALVKEGVFGFKCFLIHSGIDDFPNVTKSDLEKVMPILAKLKSPLLVHAELDHGNDGKTAPIGKSYSSYLASRPRHWENKAIEMMIELAKSTGCHVHIVHLSSSDAVPIIAKAKKEGVSISVETCPHYLTLAAEDVGEGDTRHKCAPPIREKENQEKLWKAIKDGVIDFIVSDHSPCTPHLKALDKGDFSVAWGGISSLQFGLSTVWTEAKKRGYTLCDVTELMSKRPAEFVGMSMRKGQIASGYDADIVIFDPDATMLLEQSMIRHKHKVTPYEGKTLYGVVEQTFVRGKAVFAKGHLSHSPYGEFLLRKTTEGMKDGDKYSSCRV